MMNNFNASIKFDKRLCFQDLELNKAHSSMLADKKIITSNENKKIQKGLKLIENEIKNDKFSEVFELNNDNKSKKIFYMLENSKIMKFMISKIKQIKSISIKSHEKISEISTSGLLKSVKINNNKFKYNLIIICVGNNSDLVKNLFNDQIIENSYNEVSISAILKHSSLKNNTVRQIFLDNEILALLPISNTRTSIVWSLKKDIKEKNDLCTKKKIEFYVKNYLKNATFATNIEYKDLSFKNFIETKIEGRVLGPVNAPIFRLKRKFRVRLLIRGIKSMKVQDSIAKIIPNYKFAAGIKLSVDVDPINFN